VILKLIFKFIRQSSPARYPKESDFASENHYQLDFADESAQAAAFGAGHSTMGANLNFLGGKDVIMMLD
jgi:hypothetical protein